jgi:hypothetical protein
MRTDPKAHAKAKAGKLGKAKPSRGKAFDGDRAPTDRKPAKADLLASLRALTLALPEGFDADTWISGLPTFQRREAVREVRALVHRLGWLLSRLKSPQERAAKAEGEALTPRADAFSRVVQEQGLILHESKVEPAHGDDDLRRRLSDRLADHMGSTGMAGAAQQIGVSAPTLKAFLAGNPIYAKTRAKIEAYLRA